MLWARDSTLKYKSNEPGDLTVNEMLQELLLETVYEVTHLFRKRFKGECGAPAPWKLFEAGSS